MIDIPFYIWMLLGGVLALGYDHLYYKYLLPKLQTKKENKKAESEE